MSPSPARSSAFAALLFVSVAALVAGGCSRSKYRLQADVDAYNAIAERNVDPRWNAPNTSIEIDPRSRYFDVCDPDHSPMPLDDEASNQYMQIVDGKRGWKHWLRNGGRSELENPAWREALAEYVELDEDGSVKLDVDSALRLAYVHSPNHQRQLETLYLSSLDVTAERFRLDTQFFGGYDTVYNHRGSLVPASLTYDPAVKHYVVTPPVDVDALENNRLTLGRPGAADPVVQMNKRFATAGELIVGFANSFVFEFTSGDASLTSSLANFSFIQPLLRGAGKDVALEQLTRDERNLLAALRAYGQFRQGFYTQVAIGELGVTGPQRTGSGTTLQSFSGQGGVNGYLGLLQQSQQIYNAEENLNLQRRTLARLEALYANGLTRVVQVDQFRQSVESQRASLLALRNSYELSLDNFKARTIGLPPNLPVELDETLIEQFELIPREGSDLQDDLVKLQAELKELPDVPEVAVIEGVLEDCFAFADRAEALFETADKDIQRMDDIVEDRERMMTDEDKELFRIDRERLHKRLGLLKTGSDRSYDVEFKKLKELKDKLAEATRRETFRGANAWVGRMLELAGRLSLVPAQARLELITVESIKLSGDDAFQIALGNRLDFMNGRAALVDQWRLIQVSADALQSVVNITSSGDIRTARNNPLSFRAPTGSVRLGLEFDAPFTRLLERNAYRESLINYQQSRRSLIQSRDSLQLGLRALLRTLEQQRQNLEIQRRAVSIATRRVDETQLSLNPARPALQPGQRAPVSETTAINLLSAQGSLQQTQNNFLAAWLSYYATRIRLYRELGIMQLDQEGRWIEQPIGADAEDVIDANTDDTELEELPPGIPEALLEQLLPPPETANGPRRMSVEPVGYRSPNM